MGFRSVGEGGKPESGVYPQQHAADHGADIHTARQDFKEFGGSVLHDPPTAQASGTEGIGTPCTKAEGVGSGPGN